MMSAKEMFNALGYYEKDVGYTNILCYEKDVSFPNVPHYIGLQFVLNHEYISIYSHVGGRYEHGKECHYSYGAFNGFDAELLRAIEQQMKELGWLDEKTETEEARNPEVTNLDHYKQEVLENCMWNLAIVKGKPKRCNQSRCSDCEFDKEHPRKCHEMTVEWLKQPYIEPTYKLTKFENDLLQSYAKGFKFIVVSPLIRMKEKGYFKGIDDNELIGDILAKCEVVG